MAMRRELILASEIGTRYRELIQFCNKKVFRLLIYSSELQREGRRMVGKGVMGVSGNGRLLS